MSFAYHTRAGDMRNAAHANQLGEMPYVAGYCLVGVEDAWFTAFGLDGL